MSRKDLSILGKIARIESRRARRRYTEYTEKGKGWERPPVTEQREIFVPAVAGARGHVPLREWEQDGCVNRWIFAECFWWTTLRFKPILHAACRMKRSEIFKIKMEQETGLEPATFSLATRSSTS